MTHAHKYYLLNEQGAVPKRNNNFKTKLNERTNERKEGRKKQQQQRLTILPAVSVPWYIYPLTKYSRRNRHSLLFS